MTTMSDGVATSTLSAADGSPKRAGVYRILAFALTAAAVASGIATAVALSDSGTGGTSIETIRILFLLDLAFVLVLGALVTVRLMRLWAERRRGLAGSGLLVRMVVIFSLVAVTPAVLVAAFSVLFGGIGLQTWFSDQVRTAVLASNAVAQSYLKEHRQGIVAEAFAMANDLNRDAAELMSDPRLFSHRLSLQANLRSLPEALVFDSNGRVLARTPLSLSLELDLGLISGRDIDLADRGLVAMLATESEDRARALVRLAGFPDAYLVIGRFVDVDVLSHIEQTAQAVSIYKGLEERREGLLWMFVAIFAVMTLLLLLAAVWTGLTLSGQISKPVSDLIIAADRIRKGDLGVRVDTSHTVEELDTLGRAFNRMTGQLETQRHSLVVANRQLDERRQFTEAVLSGVSAGVIGLDRDGRINLPNRSASELLGTELEERIGAPLRDIAPEMGKLVDTARVSPDRTWESEIVIVRDGRPATFFVRIVAERLRNQVVGFVATFDDITPLVAAQRTAAWADVARRVAHEIKNPLTPIQLAAERLNRKYAGQIESERDTFKACVDTIVRRVEDIRRMVDEFSSFARMPRPDPKMENLSELLRQAVFLERTRSPRIRFELDLPRSEVKLRCDGRQIAQALTNLLKNAAEAISERGTDDDDSPVDGVIRAVLNQDRDPQGADRIRLVIEDDGPGLPDSLRDRLTEPYVTSRAGGTGLGLAIVRKIVEDHGAELIIENREKGGARVSIVFHGGDGAAAATADAVEAGAFAGTREFLANGLPATGGIGEG